MCCVFWGVKEIQCSENAIANPCVFSEVTYPNKLQKTKLGSQHQHMFTMFKRGTKHPLNRDVK
jgi:hypothetical protein